MAANLARTWLFVPGSRPDRFDKAVQSGAEAIIIDLEDAVSPRDKDRAREAALEHLSGYSRSSAGPAQTLRINPLDSPAGIADIGALLASGADPFAILLPKTESAAHVSILDRLLTGAGKEARLVALIESARGLAGVDAIAETAAKAAPRLIGMMMGAADMAADLGARTDWEPLLYARSRVMAACALGHLLPIDAPFFDVQDADGLEREVSRAVSLGFRAKAAIHPGQLVTIEAAFTPTAEAVEEARAILAENAKGVGTVGGHMVDEAVARKARAVLDAAGVRADAG